MEKFVDVGEGGIYRPMGGTPKNSRQKPVSLWRDRRAGLQGDRVGIGRCDCVCCLEQASLPPPYFRFALVCARSACASWAYFGAFVQVVQVEM